jgi:flagellar basal body-associated protein FliL
LLPSLKSSVVTIIIIIIIIVVVVVVVVDSIVFVISEGRVLTVGKSLSKEQKV